MSWYRRSWGHQPGPEEPEEQLIQLHPGGPDGSRRMLQQISQRHLKFPEYVPLFPFQTKAKVMAGSRVSAGLRSGDVQQLRLRLRPH